MCEKRVKGGMLIFTRVIDAEWSEGPDGGTSGALAFGRLKE
jgi:hypothetical protein